MAVRYIPFYPDPTAGQAILNNFRRMLLYHGSEQLSDDLRRGMPLYEVKEQEQVGDGSDGTIVRGECVSACAWLRAQGKKVDLVYIDPPFASGADYAKQVYVRPRIAEKIKSAGQEVTSDELKAFEEKMYGDVWDKEKYLNWMYENLMAIKSVMSERASIYVHLDWHIVHYIKVLMDEIFGEDNFCNDIIWHYSGWNKKLNNSFEKRHDVILLYAKDKTHTVFNSYFEKWGSEEEYVKKRKQKLHEDVDGRKYVYSDAGSGKRVKRYLDEAIQSGVVVDDVWDLDKLNNSAKESVEYATQKPEALLERIIRASSDKGMLVADFFGGSGVTAAVAHRLGRPFLHVDIGINSIQTARDRLAAAKAGFHVYEVKDGVQLYRNPVQTMDKIKELIPGLKNEDDVDEFWEGVVTDSRDGMIPVYIPNLMDSTTKLLTKALMNRILRLGIPSLPPTVKKVCVYYIDIDDEKAIRKFIQQDKSTLVEIELCDLKPVLDGTVLEDDATVHVTHDVGELLYTVHIDQFASDRVAQKIAAYNEKGFANSGRRPFQPIEISEEGLETIEALSLDCESGERTAVWHSASDLRIDKAGFVIRNGVKTDELWDGTIQSTERPLRLKIRNICGDESIYVLDAPQA